MREILEAIMEAGDSPASERCVEKVDVPGSYQAMVVREEEAGMFDGLPNAEKDPANPFTCKRFRRPRWVRARR